MVEGGSGKTRYLGTNIDGPLFLPEALGVRGCDLNDLIGSSGYTQAILNLVCGIPSDAHTVACADRFLVRSAVSLVDDSGPLRLAAAALAEGATPAAATASGLMADRREAASVIATETGLAACDLGEDVHDGLYSVATAPALLSHAVSLARSEDGGTLPARLTAAQNSGDDFVSLLYRSATGRGFASEAEQALFEAVLVAWHGGFGVVTPTVILARVAVGTGVAISQAIAAGLLGGGPFHIGACAFAMRFFQRLVEASASKADLRAIVDRGITEAMAARGRIYGFGHPLFEQDPRPPRLRALVKELGLEAPEISVYDSVAETMLTKKGLRPNIDAITAAVFLRLGIQNPDLGSGLALCARTAAMLAHAIERKHKPPFGVTSATARKYFETLQVDWL